MTTTPIRILSLFALATASALSPLFAQSVPLTPSTDAPAKSDVVVLSPFEVSAGRDEGYAPSESLSGTKVRTQLRDIPMNIQVVTEQFIEDIDAFDLQEAMAYNASVSVSDNSYQVQIRGFNSDWQLRNGFRYYKRTDTAKVSRIELVSGPAAVLYGISQPGGILNVITKQPTGKNSGSIRQTFAVDGDLRTDADFNVRVNDQVSLRLVGAYEEDDSDTDFNDSRFSIFSPTLSWRLSDKTRLVIDADWTHYPHHFTSGYLLMNNVPIQAPASVGGFDIPESFNYEGPGSYYDEDTRTFFVTLEHTFNSNISGRLAYNSHTQDSTQEYMSVATTTAPAGNPEGIATGTRVVRGTWRKFVLNNEMQSLAADTVFKFNTGPVQQQLLVGGQVGVDKFYSPRYYDQTPAGALRYRYWSLSDMSPELDQPSDINYVFQTALSTSSRREENTVASAYVTHQAHLLNDRIITLAGVFVTSIDNYIRAFGGQEQRYSASDTNPQFGIVGRPLDWLSVYALYATSLYPQTGGSTGGFGEIFPPVQGKSFEYGVKVETSDHKLSGTLSIYDIRQENRVIFDPTAPNADNPTGDPDLPRGANVATGETRSKGVDLSAYYRVMRDVQLVGSYAYNDTEILHDAQAYLVGRKVTPYYRNRAALWVKYAPEKLKGWSAGVGGTWHGEGIRSYSSSSATGIPNTVDAAYNLQVNLSYTHDFSKCRTTFMVNGSNLLGAETVVGGLGDVGYYFDTDPQVRFSVKVAF